MRRSAARAPPGLRIWIDIGTEEGGSPQGRAEAVSDARALCDALIARGYRDGSDLHFEVVEGAHHDERAWAMRLDRVLTFLLAPTPGDRPSGR